MATDKKSFILYADLIHTVNKIPDETAGKLLKHILAYVNDLNPETDDLLVEIAFEPIKQAMKRDLRKWETEIDRKSQGAILGNLKRWHVDLYEKVQKNEITLGVAQSIAYHRIPSHSDKTDGIATKSIASIAVSVNDSVNVNDNVNVINKEKDISTESDVKKLEYQQKLKDFDLQCEKMLVYYNHTFEKQNKVVNQKVKDKLKKVLVEYNWEDIAKAMREVKKSQHHSENGYRWATLEFFTRPEKLDMYAFTSTAKTEYTGEDAGLVNHVEKYLKAVQS